MTTLASPSRFPLLVSHQRGATLVELMVAGTVGFFLIAGILSLFTATKQSYRANEAMSRLQENGRYALEFLSRDIRQAGYREITGITAPPLPNAIEGWAGAASAPSGPALPTTPPYTANTDVLRIRFVVPNSSPVVTRALTYYIGGTTAAPGLRQRVLDTPPGTTALTQELMEGVFDMQVSYGIDANGDGRLDSYANTPGNWNQVIAVRINLLLGSDDNLAEAPMSLPFENNDGTFFTATDRRIYQMFSTTVALRNRLL